MPFELQIALRYLLAKRKQALISVISLISIVGVAVGVLAVIVALAIMTGLQQEVQNRILGANSHIYVWKRGGGIPDFQAEADKLRKVPHVLGAAPAILGQGLISASGALEAIQIKGIDPTLEGQVTAIGTAIRTGTLAGINPGASGDLGGILLGADLASKLGVKAGDTVTLQTLQGTLSPFGLIPRSKSLRVAGTFSLGLFEIDSTFGFVALDRAKRLLDVDDVQLIQLRIDDIYKAPDVRADIERRFGSEYILTDWTQENRTLYHALWLEKVAVSIAIFLIVMVAALNIVATLILLVMEKHRDIAILKTMGTSARSVTTIFMLQGLVIGVVGTMVGATLGYVICTVLDRYQLIRIPADVYQVSHLPFTILWTDFSMVIVAAIVICFVATIYPSRQAARLDPAQALRYE
jgi:lipoprotein-releasing system permease protein